MDRKEEGPRSITSSFRIWCPWRGQEAYSEHSGRIVEVDVELRSPRPNCKKHVKESNKIDAEFNSPAWS
jgi:hypothetical protein